MKNIKKEKIFKDLQAIEDIKERFAYIIKFGKESAKLSEEEKIEDNRIKNCNSQLWLVANLYDNKIYFKVDSDASIPKGLGAILAQIFSGLPPNKILANDIQFLANLGINQHLSMNRRNGLANIIKQINYYALAYSIKLNK